MKFTLILAAGALLAATSPGSYLEEAAKWRVNYETKLKSPSGWLSVAGLFWLHEGASVIGSDPQSDVVLPGGAPKRAGILRLQNRAVTFEPQGAGVLINGKPASKAVLKTDATEHEDVVRIGDVSMTIIERGKKIGVRLRDPNAETRRDFTGCKWYPADAGWRVKAKWVAYSQPKKLAITNILGMTEDDTSPGYAEFAIQGKTVRLEPVIDEGELFFMFKDATSGKTTYGAGRFLYAPIPKGPEVELDFNKAHNPPCAFTAFATCPLPPRQNTMALAVEAGEKNYGKH